MNDEEDGGKAKEKEEEEVLGGAVVVTEEEERFGEVSREDVRRMEGETRKDEAVLDPGGM